MNFKVINDEGKEIVCEIVTVFKDESNNINYIIYTDGTKNESGKLEVYASRYIIRDNNYILQDIEKDYEWDLVDNYLLSMNSKTGV